MRLGEMLLAEKLITQQGLEEALESQVVHGGRLGTNLVELGLLSEKDLARVLGKQHNVAYASGEMLPDPRALELVDAHFADEKDLLPMRVEPTRLSVAVLNPHDFQTLDAIAFKVGRRVVPVVIPEFRMNQLLRRYCKAFRLIRAIDMNTIRPSRTLGTLKEDGKAAADSPELMSEEEFQSLYAQALSGGTAARPEVAAVAESRPVVVAPSPPPPSAPPAPPPARSAPVAPAPAAPRQVAPPPARPAPPVPEPVAPEPPPSPLTFAEAQQLLAQSSHREDIARTVLRFAIGKWRRALLLSVQEHLVTGWQGMGQGVQLQAVQRIGVVLRGQSTFKLVRDTRSHYIGPIRRDAGTGAFYKLLGAGYPTTAVLLPLLVRGKVVHILYLDNGPDQVTPPDVGELLILSQSVGRSYEALMRRRKSA